MFDFKIGDKVQLNVPGKRVHGRVGRIVFIENIGVVDHVVVLDDDETKTPRYFMLQELLLVN